MNPSKTFNRTARRIALLTLLIVATVTAGCATLSGIVFKEPVVRLQDVRINNVGYTGGSLDVMLSVYNPNEFRLDATQLTYRLLVGDSVLLGTGELDSRFAVQSGDSTEVRLPVDFTYAGVGRAASQLLQTGAVNYRVMGDLTVGTPLGDFTRPYDRSGRYNALRGASDR